MDFWAFSNAFIFCPQSLPPPHGECSGLTDRHGLVSDRSSVQHHQISLFYLSRPSFPHTLHAAGRTRTPLIASHLSRSMRQWMDGWMDGEKGHSPPDNNVCSYKMSSWSKGELWCQWRRCRTGRPTRTVSSPSVLVGFSPDGPGSCSQLWCKSDTRRPRAPDGRLPPSLQSCSPSLLGHSITTHVQRVRCTVRTCWVHRISLERNGSLE